MKVRKWLKIWLGIGGIGLVALLAGVVFLAQADQAKDPEEMACTEAVQASQGALASPRQVESQGISPSQQKGFPLGADAAKAALTIRDFPSPVQGSPLRKAGNYYCEALQTYLFHAGTDFAQAEGAVIRATHGGTVLFVGPDPLLGQKVVLDCGEGWIVTYGGLDNLRVQVGDRIEKSQALGQVGYYPGADGVGDQSQLHYEVWHGDEVQIPEAN